MRLLKSERFLFLGAPALFLALAVFGVLLVSESESVSAADEECNVVIALDKSDSILPANLETLKENVTALITRLGDQNISIAFWAFSHEDDDTGDYNLPRHDYVPTNVDELGLQEFKDSLPKASQLRGQTDYAQAFGYSAGDPDLNAVRGIEDITLTSNNAVNSIRSRADVFVLLTDGAPNYPGTANDNKHARWAGREARNQYPDNVAMIGGYITNDPNFVPVSLNYVINGSDNDNTRVGPVSYDGEENQIYDYVSQKLLEVCPTTNRADYSLKPIVNKTVDVAQKDDVVTFTYDVDKESDTDNDATRSSNWQLFDVILGPEVAGNPLEFNISNGPPSSVCANSNGAPYCNNISSCTVLMARVANPGPDTRCTEGTAGDSGIGSDTYNHGLNRINGSGRDVTIGDYPLGTRVCSVLMLRTASLSSSFRASRATCVVIAKAPLVQVHGGDIRVGRHFTEDTTPRDTVQDEGNGSSDDMPGVYTSRFKISQDQAIVPEGRTYGSWVEYGVLAPGPVERIASLSGYAGPHGGYDARVDSSSCDTNINRLTFANSSDASEACGGYKYMANLGEIPDVVSAVTTGTAIDPDTYAQPLVIDEDSPGGIYKNESDIAGVNFTIGESKLFKTPPPAKGKTHIIYVPHGTVTITGNISYDNPSDRYGDVSEIPQMIIIAKDINIQSNVTQVSAWLIASGDGENGGTLDTCTGFSVATCKEQLTINGPVMARYLGLYRTTVREDSCRIEVIEDCADVGRPAEIINLPGSSILWTQGFNENTARARTTSTIELPPYF